MALLSVRSLGVDHRETTLLDTLTFDVDRGERLGIIGESGSGKTLCALAIISLLGRGLRVRGKVLLDGVDLLGLSESELSKVRGDRISMIFQEPMTALNPLMRVARQVAEVLRIHRGRSRRSSIAEAEALLGRVGFEDPHSQGRAFPHQLSGGQRQRIMVAMALACRPDLVLADEPTTALDVTVQKQVLDLIRELVASEGTALVFISHDLAVVAELCERVIVMYGGTIVEDAPLDDLLERPQHPYTAALLETSRAMTSSGSEYALGHLPTIEGSVPSAGALPVGCVFSSRCPYADAACAVRPELTVGPHRVACVHPLGVSNG